MSSFTRPLELKVENHARRILKPYRFWLGKKYESPYILVPQYFLFDGASIPRMLWPIVGHPYDSDYVQAAGVHDVLYRYNGKVSMILEFCNKDLIATFLEEWEDKGLIDKVSGDYSGIVCIKFSRKGADEILKLGCDVLPCSAWKAKLIYTGVRIGGWWAWLTNKKRLKGDSEWNVWDLFF